MISFIRSIQKGRCIGEEIRLVVAPVGWLWGVTSSGYEVSLEGDEDGLRLDHDSHVTLSILKTAELYTLSG